jgi:hypothetical protein
MPSTTYTGPLPRTTLASCCAAGYYGSASLSACTACPAGKYKAEGDSIDSTVCVECDPNAVGCTATSAVVCKAGYGSSDNGVTCTACGANTYKSVVGITECSAAAPVSAPTAAPTAGFNGPVQCGAGLYVKNKNTAHDSCAACPAGKFNSDRTTRNKRCKKCRVNTYAAFAEAHGCRACPAGFTTAGQKGKKQCFQRGSGKSMKQLSVPLQH